MFSVKMAPITLLTLPPELRTNIYELVFTSNAPEPVDICETEPPSKALALTSHQLYNETSRIYREEYHRYWANTAFQLNGEHGITDQARARYTPNLHLRPRANAATEEFQSSTDRRRGTHPHHRSHRRRYHLPLGRRRMETSQAT